MNLYSAIHGSSKRQLDQAELVFPVKKQHVVCRFLKSPNSPANKPPVFLSNSPANMQPVIPEASLVNKTRRDDGETSERAILEKEASEAILKEKYVFSYKRIENYSPPQESYRFTKEVMRDVGRADREVRRVVKERGYTKLEYEICQGYLFKREFERSPEPIPRKYRLFKKHLDQIRETRGYGLTVSCSGPDDSRPLLISNIRCIFYQYKWGKDPFVLAYVKRMEEMVVGQILEKMGKKYQCAGLVNLVVCNYYVRLASFHVHEVGTAPADAQPPEIAEAFFYMRPIDPILDNIELPEWKIRKGEEVLFSTAKISGGGATPKV